MRPEFERMAGLLSGKSEMSCGLPRFSSYSCTLVRWHAVTHLWPTILACPPLPVGPCGHTGSAHSRPQLSISLCPYLLVSARLQQDHRCEASRTARARTADANGLFRSGCDTAGKLRLYRPSHCGIDSAEPQRAVWIQRGLAPSLASSQRRHYDSHTARRMRLRYDAVRAVSSCSRRHSGRSSRSSGCLCWARHKHGANL